MLARALGLSVLSALLGCGPIVSEAPFRSRPDTLAPAELLGPYSGQVLDADTEKPIEGALVSAAWAFERGVGFVAPAGAREVLVRTDAQGRYLIPKLDLLPGGLSTRVARFTLVVYHRGYVAYRSDAIFPEMVPRRDFVQQGNLVRLVPWNETLSHARHVAFIGGGHAVQAAAAWERVLAASELAPPSKQGRTRETRKLLNAAALLTADEVRSITGFKGMFEEKRLVDLERTEFYDSKHFQAAGQPEAFDLAFRVYRLGTKPAEERYLKLRGELPNVKATDEIADRSLRASEGAVIAIAFLDRQTGTVVEMTCGTAQCKNFDVLLALGRILHARLGRLTTETVQVESPPLAPRAVPEKREPTGPGQPSHTPSERGAATQPEDALPNDASKDETDSHEEGTGSEEEGFKLQAPGTLRLPGKRGQ